MFRTQLRRRHVGVYQIKELFRRFLRSTVPGGRLFPNKDNVILMGSPGSGKTTTSKILGKLLSKPVIDIDDDHLEPLWGMSVAEKRQQVGDAEFVEEEGQALLQFSRQGCVVALTGSNPLHRQAMEHIASTGTVVFLDVPFSDITERQKGMKVERMVGYSDGRNVEDILKYRQQFYEPSYDVRIICEEHATPTAVAQQIQSALDNLTTDKGYVSTRSAAHPKQRISFLDTVLTGVADDGGLYVPAADTPTFTTGELKRLLKCSYAERALRILEKWIAPYDLKPQRLWEFCQKAYTNKVFDHPDIISVHHLEKNQYIMELFHGPTASFKDLALQLTAQFFPLAIQQAAAHGSQQKYLVLVATSGDTGGAVLDAFSRHDGVGEVGVVVFYPVHGVSELQQHQMTTMTGTNVHVVGVDGDFDFCQSTVKRLFNDKTFTQTLLSQYNCKLSAANSLNWSRLLPQVVYHVSGYLDLVKQGVLALGDTIDICVPTGNFGNILAAYYAKRMGLPVRYLVCASNINNVVTDFLQSGMYDLRGRKLHRTTSPAVDILKSSNLERLLYHLHDNDGDHVRTLYESLETKQYFQILETMIDELCVVFQAGSCTERECRQTVVNTFKKTGYILDPHTAVAKSVADQQTDDSVPMLISGTAHFAKFADGVLPLLNQDLKTNLPVPELIQRASILHARPAMHAGLTAMAHKHVPHTSVCDAKREDIMKHISILAGRLV
ncbi:threonine synthase-like 1 [Gigantopelta aegis]|uniref:threonine synthase-like 1 n=1 Tax=Gigantopelta aegis TaxID=1735272 RepID=UPI001B88842A|nr:threonine synthase-like 1 [Gigantopelta aegis]